MPYFIVLHEIKQPDAWKALGADKEKMDEIMKKIKDSKFKGHAGYGTDVTDKQFCLWQCDDEAAIKKEFPDFFHNTWAPQAVADSTVNWIIGEGAMGLPTEGQQFEQKGGNFVFVHHKVKDAAKMQQQMKEWMDKGPEAGEKINLDNGFVNHQFLPTTGEFAAKEFFCLWEMKEGKTKEDLRKHLDTYLLKPDSTEHVLYLLNGTSGGNMNVPTSKFAVAA